jgi:hypothetical protein
MDLKPFRDADVKGEMKGMSDEEAMTFIMAKWCGMCGKEGPITPKSMNQTPNWDDNWNANVTKAVEGIVTPLTAKITSLEAELSARKSTDEASQKKAIIDEALRNGKAVTLSADEIGKFSVDQLKIFTANLPKGVIPTGPLKPPVAGANGFVPLSAMKKEDRLAVLEQNRLRTLDSMAATVAAMRQGNN